MAARSGNLVDAGRIVNLRFGEQGIETHFPRYIFTHPRQPASIMRDGREYPAVSSSSTGPKYVCPPEGPRRSRDRDRVAETDRKPEAMALADSQSDARPPNGCRYADFGPGTGCAAVTQTKGRGSEIHRRRCRKAPTSGGLAITSTVACNLGRRRS